MPGVLPAGSTHSSLRALQKAPRVSLTQTLGLPEDLTGTTAQVMLLYTLEMWLSALSPAPHQPAFQPHRSFCSLKITPLPRFPAGCVYFLKHALRWYSVCLLILAHADHHTLIVNGNMD